MDKSYERCNKLLHKNRTENKHPGIPISQPSVTDEDQK